MLLIHRFAFSCCSDIILKLVSCIDYLIIAVRLPKVCWTLLKSWNSQYLPKFTHINDMMYPRLEWVLISWGWKLLHRFSNHYKVDMLSILLNWLQEQDILFSTMDYLESCARLLDHKIQEIMGYYGQWSMKNS